MLETILTIGRGWMEGILSEPAPEERAASQRMGRCGHAQQLEGYRPKQVLTLLGKVTDHAGLLPLCRGRRPSRESREGSRRGRCQPRANMHSWGSACGRVVGTARATEECGREAWGELSVRVLDPGGSGQDQETGCSPYTCQHAKPSTCCSRWAKPCNSRKMSRCVRCGTKPCKHAPPALLPRRPSKTGLSGSISNWMGCWHGCDEAVCQWKSRNASAKGMCIAKSKSARSRIATRGPTRSKLAPGVLVDQAGPKHSVARRAKAEDEGLLLYALAVTSGLQRAHQLVVLGDGAAWIWRLAAEHFPGAVQIVDVWHAREHVWKVARAVFGANTPEASAWAEHACNRLLEGKIEELVEEIVVFPPIPPEPGTSRSVPDIERDYFISNAARMRYPAFRAKADACRQWHRRSGL